jgi:ferritin-like metal-binding protein YciE
MREIQEVVSIFSEDKDVKLDISKVEESAKETEEKATKIMKTYLGEEPDTSEALEFLCLAEGGEIAHYEVLQVICGNFDNSKVLSTVKSILKEEQEHLLNVSIWPNRQFHNQKNKWTTRK